MRRLLLTLACACSLLCALGAATAGAMDLGNLIAPVSACPTQNDETAASGEQEKAMLCMTNYARERLGLRPMADSSELDRSALRKSGDMLRCDQFSHEACNRQFTYWIQRVGYIRGDCWRAGENIAWGSGSLGSVHSIFTAWIHSPGHRENILGSYGQIGIGVRTGRLEGFEGARVWTQHFGSHCGDPAPAPRRHRVRFGLRARTEA